MKYLLYGAALLLFMACKSDLGSLNTDPKGIYTAEAETFFSHAQKSLSDYLNRIGTGASATENKNVFRHFAQHITAVTYMEVSNYYIADAGVPDFMWATMYRDVLNNLNKSYQIIADRIQNGEAESGVDRNQLALIEVLNVYTISLLIDTFGNIPYSESLDIDNVQPVYDDAFDVYKDLFVRLDNAISSMDSQMGSFGSADLIYQGAVGKWLKFANSIKLRLGMRIADYDASLSANMVGEAIPHVFSANDDNALFAYLDSPPNTNPLWLSLVQSKRMFYVGTDAIIGRMNALNDPRLHAYFTPMGDGSFKGGVYGIVQPYEASSHLGVKYFDPKLPGILMDYAAVEFLLAEACERGLYASNPQTHYNNAIRASFDYHGVSGVDEYLAQTSVDYGASSPDWKEKIGTQKWLALFNQSHEAWIEYRRLDFPSLSAPPDALVESVPTRFIYPISEQTLNGLNYKAAASAIGGDQLNVKIFWDIH